MSCFLPLQNSRAKFGKNRRACRNFRIKKQGIFPLYLFSYRPAALRRFTMSRPIS